MLLSFFTILEKCVILFLMIVVGYVCGKKGMITNRGSKQITSILLYIVNPCITVSSLQSIIGAVNLYNLLVCAGLSAAAIALAVLLSYLFFRRAPAEKQGVFRYAMTYSNSGFMGIPLVEAVLGSTGVAYAAIFGAVFNVFVWSHGYVIMSGEKKIRLKQILVNPGTIGLAIGLPLFAFSVKVPSIIEVPVASFASLNTPLAMIVIGCFISRVKLRELFIDADLYITSALRLVLVPAAVFAALLPFGFDKTVATTVLLLSAAPAAANTVMFAAEFGGDTKLGSKAVALTSILSILTMPAFSALAQQFL
jgi:Predicted permeases